MLCENCGKNEANVKYTQIINGEKKEMLLCENCSKELGIDNITFNMPINFSSFFSDFLDEFEDTTFLSKLDNIRQIKCENCNTTFEEFMNNGKFGCSNCYEVFEEKINPLLKNIHGSDTHIGRIGKIEKINNENKRKENNTKKIEKEDKVINKVFDLKEQLKTAINEERYEDAAKLRDEIKKYEDNKNI